ncbi:TetR/AcrR family transcriptional regulator [Sphingomonas qomolangmaensis]|uniref:TetR/AcrR family transcriptional regulator n=1 Tax=Sphingomonas qomolangmaensis TaxID=2918765 RepID=A0ABY5LCW1_9SPHN|nr:TetR/AcrR family transcriptional regulator [Sphingomonas qomolangmaensis]UUL83946.1 TetR/AcrR family transcriptional regulator [Sphingomonas qomolangmaensis]
MEGRTIVKQSRFGLKALACCGGKPVKNGPGRPRDPAKQDAIIGAARESFIERGFNASTIEDIAQRAGVSKVTLYNRFGDKETLFEAVIRGEMPRMDSALSIDEQAGLSLEERLNLFGEGLLTFIFHEDHAVFERMLAQEITQVPALAERFFRAGPALCRGRLADLIAEGDAAGLLEVDDPQRAAEDLVGIWKGFCEIELMFGMIPEPTLDMIRERAARGTSRFMRAYAPRGADVVVEGEAM